MKRIYVVIDPLITDENSWESHLASLIHGYVESTEPNNYEVKQLTDLEYIKKDFQSGYITTDDLFIFPNAWSTMTTYIKHWSENYDIPVKMIGFWSRGCYINHDDEYRPMNDRNWRKVHERASFRCLDKSFFISEYHKEQYRIYVSKFVFPERLNIIKFPLDYLPMELSEYKDDFFKQDMIVFPWSKYTNLHEQIIYDFIRVFTHAQVIFAQEHNPLERYQLMNQIAKSKVAFLPYAYPNIGKEIYECLILGTIPLVPDIDGFKDLVPDEFRYPAEWTASIFNYCKYAPELTAKINGLMANYQTHLPLITEYQNKLFTNYFDSSEIINEIFGTMNKI